MVYLSITSENEIRTRSLGVEPEHASILLPAILDVERILQEHARRTAANDSAIMPLRAI